MSTIKLCFLYWTLIIASSNIYRLKEKAAFNTLAGLEKEKAP
jgi:hypothetical protein